MAENFGNIGETFVVIKADVDQLNREVKSLKGRIDKDAQKMGGSFGSMFTKGFAVLGGLAAIKKAFDFSIEAKNAARDAIEIRNKFNQIFISLGEMANNTAKQYADSFGLANSTAQELLASTGDLLVGFGFAESAALDLSVRVNSLAQDLASFQNFSGGAKGASDALTKAILGETESAKSLGIVIRQNTKEFTDQVEQIKKTNGLTEQQAKAVVILEEAYKQSGKAVGDYARTRNDLANVERKLDEQYKSLIEQIGTGLVPAFNLLTKAALGWMAIAKQLLSVQDNLQLWNLDKARGYYESIKNYSKEQLKSEEESLKKNFEISNKKMQGLDADSEKYKQEKRYNELLLEQFRLVNDLRSGNLDTSVFDLSGKDPGGGGGESNLKLLEAQLIIYEELYPVSEKWYNKSIELIKAQTKELIANGIKKEDALKIEKKRIDEVTESYERMKAAIGEIPSLKRTPTTLSGVDQLDKSGFSIEGTDAGDISNIYGQAESEAVFTFADAAVTSMEMAHGAMNGFFEDMYIKAEWANSMLEKAFVGMANAFISQIQRMITQWLAFQAIKAAFNLIPGGGAVFSALTGGHSGGEFIGTGSGVKKLASGGTFTVPRGFPNDSYPMLVESGERVSVTPANRTGDQDRALGAIASRMEVMNMQLINMQTSQRLKGDFNIHGKAEGRDLYFTNKKNEKVFNRIS